MTTTTGCTRRRATVPQATDKAIGEREAPALTAFNETFRDDYVADCRKGVDRWNRRSRTWAEVLRLPHVGFNRQSARSAAAGPARRARARRTPSGRRRTPTGCRRPMTGRSSSP